MKFYKVMEKRNNEQNYMRGVYLTREDAEKKCHPLGIGYHSAYIDGHWKMVADTYEYQIEETEIENPTFDIYINKVGREGTRIEDLTLDEAKEMFDKLVYEGDWVNLQIPLKQFGSIGVTTILSNEDDGFREQENAYWEAREREERENEDYSPSCPWNAPGMSIKDFI